MSAEPAWAEALRDVAHAVVVCYQWTEALDAAALAACNALLSIEERARRDRFRFDRDRRDYAAAHALTRRMLAAAGGLPPDAWRFDTSDYGKPSIVQSQAGTPPLIFNISHTHGLVACAVTRGRSLGVDVERSNRLSSGRHIASRFFAGPEITMLDTHADDDEYRARFVELWTLKESYIKAVGQGLSLPLHSFAFTYEGAEGLTFAPASADHTTWHFVLTTPSPDTRLAVAVSRDRDSHDAPPPSIIVTDADAAAMPLPSIRSTLTRVSSR